MEIGFVVLSHNQPQQVARLVRTLSRLYDAPPIACHHDTSQSPIDPGLFPSNARFVAPTIRTGWGKWSIVEAGLAGLRLLYDKADPDWFFLLSGADYPIAPASRVRTELAQATVQALIDYRHPGSDAATAAAQFGPRNPSLGHFEAPGNREMLRARYKGAQAWFPGLRRTPVGGLRLGRYTLHLPFENPFHPFDADFPCFCGDQWFAGSRESARALLNPTPRELRLRRYLSTRAVPDECYYQTVLCNRPELTAGRDSRRYTRWNGGGAHPAQLTLADLDPAFASGAWFARKFAPDDPALDRVDEVLGAPVA
ncbi:MAG TPA: beta-1,6-N-acetylglucosaminyltransferase [Novosphingobium sp.]|nr:beta-1,6-N-acetylglucosaminyltransferase [Novosphingobium sp.]